MSTMALMAVDFVENEDDQFRFELTREKLESLEKSIVFYERSPLPGHSLLSGFVIDNGKLPSSIQDLLIQPTAYDPYALRTPLFDSSPVLATGINNDAGVPLSEAAEGLYKGYRSSGYLSTPPGSSTAYYDGWANLGSPPNYGWSVSGIPLEFTVTSLGKDNLDNNPDITGYNGDLGLTVKASDWQADIAGWQVAITNYSGVDLAIDDTGSGACLRISILVYVNDSDLANNFNWKRLTSECVPGNLSTLADGSCIDGDGDGEVDGVSCSDVQVVTFPPTGGFQPTTDIPVGEHLLVLVVDDNSSPHDGSAGETPCLGSGDCSSGNRTTSRVRFFPHVLLPNLTMEIRA
ncbi:hypothetical protein MK489_19005 [Myxococcota bacterium]|nr:hypothetical protein [Myxococcota bacterium]